MPAETVAVDLPIGTTGVVAVRAKARVAMVPGDMGAMSADLGTMSADLVTADTGPPAPPGADAAGCATIPIGPGALTKLAMMLMTPLPPGAP